MNQNGNKFLKWKNQLRRISIITGNAITFNVFDYGTLMNEMYQFYETNMFKMY